VAVAPNHASVEAVAPEPPEYAGLLIRGAAYLLDGLLTFWAMAIIAVPITLLLDLPSVSGLPDTPARGFFVMKVFLAVAFLSKILAWLYFTLCESSHLRGTPGKRILGLAVIDLEGRRISFGRANKRYWAKLLSDIFYLGYLPILISDRRQGLHDRIAGTVVVRE
jgi:uncharacterized RDD family membrane protein YckC